MSYWAKAERMSIFQSYGYKLHPRSPTPQQSQAPQLTNSGSVVYKERSWLLGSSHLCQQHPYLFHLPVQTCPTSPCLLLRLLLKTWLPGAKRPCPCSQNSQTHRYNLTLTYTEFKTFPSKYRGDVPSPVRGRLLRVLSFQAFRLDSCNALYKQKLLKNTC